MLEFVMVAALFFHVPVIPEPWHNFKQPPAIIEPRLPRRFTERQDKRRRGRGRRHV